MRTNSIERLLNIIFPEDVACFACNGSANLDARGLCAACANKIYAPGMLTCPDGLDGLTAGLVYTEALHAPIYRLKYHDARYLARILARQIILPDAWRGACLVPVPLHKRRLAQRGYNQSALIARALHRRCDLPIDEALLARTRDTGTQTDLSREERAQNVAGAFMAAPAAKGRAFILVDDVLTTGSTLLSCAAALRSAGAKTVYAACACIAE